MPDANITACDIVKHHKMKLSPIHFVMQNISMKEGTEYRPYADQGNRLWLLRQAEGGLNQTAFAEKVGWGGQSGISNFETGKRAVPRDKALQLSKAIPGFDPIWLWDGEKRGLSFDLRRRIEAEEAKQARQLASGERHDV